MPVRQMKLRFDAKPTTRVVPSLLVPRAPQGAKDRGNKEAYGTPTSETVLGVAGLPPPPPAGNG